ncbi:DEAD/DEAH box helicase [Silvanigrella aquatica]|uniref:RNA helicase n=1 Tax=Silvanigrella aquatica TaxID=1915309 RepID=A0A1L4CY62_9BACT|nr:DEAD/DEAH box helicase [Silvanigrella aquatica]APJ02886.1 hypothetical protein AXG55_02695 [Silvanigrella aquatica]
MTRMTKKKEVSEKTDKTSKAKPSAIRSKKASTKADAPAPKTKKQESTKSLKETKSPTKAAPKKTKEVAAKKEKVTKAEAIKPQTMKKTASSSKKSVEMLPQETLFPDISPSFPPKAVEVQAQKESLVQKNEVAPEKVIHKLEEKVTKQQLSSKFKPLILTLDTIPAPQYVVPNEMEKKTKNITFENLIASDSIIEAVKKAGFLEPNETLQKALPATLRGSDVLLLKPKEVEGFLIGTVTAASKILSESLPKGTAQCPSVLFISPSQKKADEVYLASQAIFNSLGISVAKLNENSQAEDNATVTSQSIDVLVATPKSMNAALQSKSIKSKNIGLCFAMEAQSFTNEEIIADLEQTLAELSQDRTQKIITSNENSPYVREFSFKFLEDPEYISTLPSQIKERNPKQFAHSLQATQKFQVLLGHLKTHKPNCAAIFANTKAVAEWIAFKLHGNGIKVELITSQLSPQKKVSLAKSIRSGEVNVIVTNDAIANSLGIRELNCIYNFDLPDVAETFMKRIARIEGAKNPIAVSFICEDYGFNIKAIENTLGFKIHIATPDKNYFNLKDISEYPLEPSGKVKRIGVVYDEVVEETKEEIVQPKVESKIEVKVEPKTTKKYELESSNTTRVAPPQAAGASAFSAKLYPRPESENKEENAAFAKDATSKTHSTASFSQKPFEPRKNAYQQGNRPQFDSSMNRAGSDKFVRRDERAKDAIDAARLAAKAANEKRRDRTTQKTATSPKRPGLFDIMVSLVQDAVQSAAHAAKESVANNIQENLPKLSTVLDRFKILKKPSKLPEDNNKE